MDRGGWVRVAVVALAAGAGGCFLLAASERGECDRALEAVCACPGVDCEADPPAVVETLRRCEGDEIFRDRGYHLAVCIQESGDYCRVLGGLASQDGALCDVACSQPAACDLEDACHDFQSTKCDPPPVDGGVDAH